jgi:hypothetical protein
VNLKEWKEKVIQSSTPEQLPIKFVTGLMLIAVLLAGFGVVIIMELK